ncbi:pyridoxamine 5'-phosphate oxidase family protein [Thermocrispum agreste]|uniref:pyridoxamine 5'-phosphate oxidase family protein n=1 Tax=Thermocrispum agreste TaxID=37925 RepID=UPI00040E809B|nr:pyridoxamine 5'-phosphate oxidase family protein [Thermocrispum agreste]
MTDTASPAQENTAAGPLTEPTAAPSPGRLPEPRSRAQRRRDTEYRLNHDIDLWVSSASPDGVPHLVPLSFEWDGRTLLMATPTDSVTGRNLASAGQARVALGDFRDVVMIDGTVEVFAIDQIPRERADRFAARAGFDPRPLSEPFSWFVMTPRRIQAWRAVNEMSGRLLMKDGRWLA